MKRVPEGAAPDALSKYVEKHPRGDPLHTWDAFCTGTSDRKKALMTALFQNQKGICAYCEIRLDDPQVEVNGVDRDIQVEHFHPQHDRENPPVPECDWALYWPNLYAGCLGSTNKNIIDPRHYAESTKTLINRHCGDYKGGDVVDADILNPRKIPLLARVFKVFYRGENRDELWLAVNEDGCRSVALNPEVVRNTIDAFNLNCKLLTKLRFAAMSAVRNKIRQYVQRGNTPSEARKIAVRMAFSTDDALWPQFFTTLRIMFNPETDDYLRSIDYSG